MLPSRDWWRKLAPKLTATMPSFAPAHLKDPGMTVKLSPKETAAALTWRGQEKVWIYLDGEPVECVATVTVKVRGGGNWPETEPNIKPPMGVT